MWRFFRHVEHNLLQSLQKLHTTLFFLIASHIFFFIFNWSFPRKFLSNGSSSSNWIKRLNLCYIPIQSNLNLLLRSAFPDEIIIYLHGSNGNCLINPVFAFVPSPPTGSINFHQGKRTTVDVRASKDPTNLIDITNSIVTALYVSWLANVARPRMWWCDTMRNDWLEFPRTTWWMEELDLCTRSSLIDSIEIAFLSGSKSGWTQSGVTKFQPVVESFPQRGTCPLSVFYGRSAFNNSAVFGWRSG